MSRAVREVIARHEHDGKGFLAAGQGFHVVAADFSHD